MDNTDFDRTIVMNADDVRAQYEASLKAGQVTKHQDIGPGSVLGNWRILQMLAEGGMGEIFVCHPIDDPQSRAVIKLLRSGTMLSPTGKKRFHREYQLQKDLDHPCIAKMLDGHFDCEPEYIVIEYVEGISLAQAVAENYEFPLDYCIYMLEVLGETFQYAWDQFKVLHRDIKPSNIMLKESGELVVLDFGIAKSLDDEESVLTQCGQVLGSPGFMSPEQIKQVLSCDCRTDIFSLGATVYYLLTRKTPFQGSNIAAVYDDMIHGRVTPLEELNPAIPSAFSDLIAQMLETAPERRPQNWAEFLEMVAVVKETISPT